MERERARRGCLALMVALAGCARAPVSGASAPGLSLEEARAVVSGFEARLARDETAEPLRQPRSSEDLLQILKRDQLDLFPAGVAFARGRDEPEARALGAQIELAWGEAQLDLARLFARLAAHHRDRLARLTASAYALSEEQARQAEARLREDVAREERLAEALPHLAAEHVAAGGELARSLVAASPDNYLGYRLLADFQRLRGAWEEVDAALARVESTNARSNGLLFLKAMRELDRFDRPEAARALLREAVERDPRFVRARAALLRTAGSVEERYQLLKELEQASPRHHLVVWAGPAITRAYQELQRARSGPER